MKHYWIKFFINNIYITEKNKSTMISLEDKINNAKKFAQERHKNQTKKDQTTSYFEHLEGVVYRLKNLGVTDSNTICAGWLHDILEKTETTFEEINERFGREVAIFVLSLSKNNKLSNKERELQYIKQLREAPIEAKIIKLCDISSNIKDLDKALISKTQKNKKIRKILHYLRVLKKDISTQQTKYPKIYEVIEGINKVAIKFKLKPILI